MQRIGFRMKINPEHLEEYVKLHENVDQPLIEEYRKLGVRNYSIFFDEEGSLFAFMECEDWAAFLNAVANSPHQKTWGEKVYHMFQVKPDQPGGMILLQEAFHMDLKEP